MSEDRDNSAPAQSLITRVPQEEVLILEDDMEIWRWPSRDILADAPQGWGILQLYMLGDRANELYSDPPSMWVPWAPGIFNTGAYIINRQGMQRVRFPDPAMARLCTCGERSDS